MKDRIIKFAIVLGRTKKKEPTSLLDAFSIIFTVVVSILFVLNETGIINL